MKEDLIKSDIKKTAIKLGSIAALLIAIFIALFIYSDSLNDEYEGLKRRVSSLSSEVSQKRSVYSNAEEKLTGFLKLSNKKLPSEMGYSQSYQRIKEVLPKIETLKENYSFKKLTFTLGKIEQESTFSNSDIDAYKGGLSLYFEGVSDQYIYSFVKDLNHLLPGYLKLNEFYVTKKAELRNSNIKSFLLSKNFHFISGKLDFEWITLKHKIEERK